MLVRLRVFRGALAPGRIVRVSSKVAAAWIERGWAEHAGDESSEAIKAPTVDDDGEPVAKVQRRRKRRRRKL